MEWVTTPAGVLVSIAAAVGACGVIWKKLLRPFVRALRRLVAKVEAVHELADRELTHNGGMSLKDAVHRIDGRVQQVEAKQTAHGAKLTETGDAVEAIAQFIDQTVDRRQEENTEIWEAFRQLGVDRRRER